MSLTAKMKQKVALAADELLKKANAVREQYKVEFGATAAPVPGNIHNDDPLLGAVNTDWVSLIEPEYSAAAAVIREALKEVPDDDVQNYPALPLDKVWLWGGPTPYWGGSMAEDILVRTAPYFQVENGVYVYGATDEKTMQIHSGFKKLICQVNSNCRTPGAQGGLTDAENAEYLSKLSLQFPNITGAICDDLGVKYKDVVPGEPFMEINNSLKKHNPDLKLYGVVYAHELESGKDFSAAAEHLDGINFWFWHIGEVLEYDRYIELCRKIFPGKAILQGIFLHEYGISDAGQMPELLIHQLERCRKYLAQGVLEGVILLGSREIRKWPGSAEAVRDYLLG